MRIVCVAGGSYKSFYINCFLKLKKCNLLIFNYGIIYNYNTKAELLGDALVTKELMSLAKALRCLVVAGVFVENFNKKTKSIIVCNGDKIQIENAKQGAKIMVGNKSFIVGDELTDYKKQNKIILCNKRIEPNLTHCSKRKIYVFCDKFGVSIVQNKKKTRKFYKYSKFILK